MWYTTEICFLTCVLFSIYLNKLFIVLKRLICLILRSTVHFMHITLMYLLWSGEWNKMHPSSSMVWILFMKLNKNRCHLIASRHQLEAVLKMLGQRKILEPKCEKLFDVVIGRHLCFNDCVKSKSKQTLMEFFIEPHFDYCHLTYLF